MKELLHHMELVPGARNSGENIAKQANPIVLAYLGDAVYEMYVRTRLIYATDTTSARLHKDAVKSVSAKGQALALHNIYDSLSDAEKDIIRRGRNAKSNTVSKNADIAEYRWATAFEALVGFLFLSGSEERLYEIMSCAFDADQPGKGELMI